MKTLFKLPNVGEVIHYHPQEDLTILAYTLNIINNTYYIYVQNRIIAIEIQHTVGNDPTTGDLYDEYHEIDSNIICDYCIIPEVDYILKRD